MKRIIVLFAILISLTAPALVLAAGNDFSIPNPLGSRENIGDIFDMVSGFLLKVAIPVAVIMIVWAGFNFLTSQGNPAKVQKGKDILTWTVVGLAIIFLSSGLVSFLQSILGGDSSTTQQQSGSSARPASAPQLLPTVDPVSGRSCADSGCPTGYYCEPDLKRCQKEGVMRACTNDFDCINGLTCQGGYCKSPRL